MTFYKENMQHQLYHTKLVYDPHVTVQEMEQFVYYSLTIAQERCKSAISYRIVKFPVN